MYSCSDCFSSLVSLWVIWWSPIPIMTFTSSSIVGSLTSSNVPDRYTFTSAYDGLAGTATVTFPTVTGRTYRVMSSPDLLSWQPGSAVVAGTGAPLQWTDDGTVTGSLPSSAGKRFYRIEVVVLP